MRDTAPQFGRVPFAPIAAGAIAKMKGADARVYLALCAHTNTEWSASPGIRRLATLTGLQVGSVSRSLHRLADLGVIHVEWAGNGRPATYTLTVHRGANGREGPSVHHGANATVHRGANGRGAPPFTGAQRDRSPGGAQPFTGARTKQKEQREEQTTTTGNGARKTGGGGGGGEKTNQSERQTEAALRRLGVAKAAKIADQTNVAAIADWLAGPGRDCPNEHLAGRLVRAIEAGDLPPAVRPTWAGLCEAIKRRLVAAVAGVAVEEIRTAADMDGARLVDAGGATILAHAGYEGATP